MGVLLPELGLVALELVAVVGGALGHVLGDLEDSLRLAVETGLVGAGRADDDHVDGVGLLGVVVCSWVRVRVVLCEVDKKEKPRDVRHVPGRGGGSRG